MNVVNTVINSLIQQTEQLLPDINALSEAQLAVVFLVYGRLISEDFVPWLASTWTRCRSEIAREACRLNLRDEVIEDHPEMLRHFIAPVEVYGNLATVRSAVSWALQSASSGEDAVIPRLRQFCTDENPLNGLWVMTALENTSVAFIKWLDEAADRLGINDKTYLAKHGEADVAHATQFAEAVAAEAIERGVDLASTDPSSYAPLVCVLDLLRHIFSSSTLEGHKAT